MRGARRKERKRRRKKKLILKSILQYHITHTRALIHYVYRCIVAGGSSFVTCSSDVGSFVTCSSDVGGSQSLHVSGVYCMLYGKVHTCTEVRIFRIPTILRMISPACDVLSGVHLLSEEEKEEAVETRGNAEDHVAMELALRQSLGGCDVRQATPTSELSDNSNSSPGLHLHVGRDTGLVTGTIVRMARPGVRAFQTKRRLQNQQRWRCGPKFVRWCSTFGSNKSTAQNSSAHPHPHIRRTCHSREVRSAQYAHPSPHMAHIMHIQHPESRP
jgi:hypothetical protein